MNGTAKFALFVFILITGEMLGSAQSYAGRSINASGLEKSAGTYAPDTPMATGSNAKSWEYGPFVTWGTGVGDRSEYKFLSAGLQAGKPLTRVLHAGILSGQFELGANVMPLWQAYTPAPHEQEYTCVDANGQPVRCLLPVGGGTFYGVSITPVILRWNFAMHSKRFQPWFQGAGGLVYTTHKFPPNFLSTPTIDGGTSVWNFTPQGGIGAHYFTGANRSIDVGVNAIHISSASLGDRNPGVNASIQIQVGYTFWR